MHQDLALSLVLHFNTKKHPFEILERDIIFCDMPNFSLKLYPPFIDWDGALQAASQMDLLLSVLGRSKGESKKGFQESWADLYFNA